MVMTDVQPAVIFYVASGGNDAWSGRVAVAGAADGPFATPARAQQAVRALKRQGLAPGGVRVELRGGDYMLPAGLVFTAEDAGTPEAPITWRAAPGETARLLGGRTVTEWQPVTDPAVLARLDPAARPHVRCADLRALGITDYGRLASRGFGRAVTPAHLELFYQDRPMTLARWPNDGFVTIAAVGVPDQAGDGHGGQVGTLEGGFHYTDDRPARWQDTSDIWVHGYWTWDWANSYEQIDRIDPATRRIYTRKPFGNYSFRTGQRYFYLNILEELDQPGEYYLDRKSGILYFWPPEGDGTAVVSLLETPLIAVKDAAHLSFEGFILEAGRGSGITVQDGSHVRVAGCTLRNLGNIGVDVRGGTAHEVSGCDVYEVGDAGINISGGDYATLTPAGHLAYNNHIHHYARWSRCYQGGMGVYGVGNRASHNLIHDAPHVGLQFGGNDHVLEFNEIHHVTLETGDCGAMYFGRSLIRRGTLIRHNFIHHTGGVGMGSMGVYLDDQLSGHIIEGNVFWQVTRAAFIGGGRDNIVANNIFVDCVPAVHVDGRGLVGGPVWGGQVVKLKEEIRAMDPAVRALYRERYPALATLDRYLDTEELLPPEGNVIDCNISVGGRWLDIVWGADAQYLQIGVNLVDVDPHFIDAAAGNFQLRDDSPAWAIGFQRIPVEEMGLVGR